jgi:hypothetical protein
MNHLFRILFILGLSTGAWAQEEVAPAPTEKAVEKTVEKPVEKVAEQPKQEKEIVIADEDKAISRAGFDVHGQLGLPYGTAIGIDYFTESRSWSFGLNAGGFSGKDSANDVTYQLSQIGVSGRFHPWQSAFYLGIIVGAQTAKLSAKKLISGFEAQADLEVKNNFVTPNIGWMWVNKQGFSWGFELGAQLPSNAKTTLTSNTDNTAITSHPDYVQARRDAEDAGDKFGKMTLPHLTILRIGYVF